LGNLSGWKINEIYFRGFGWIKGILVISKGKAKILATPNVSTPRNRPPGYVLGLRRILRFKGEFKWIKRDQKEYYEVGGPG